jgi:thioredoxin reductase
MLKINEIVVVGGGPIGSYIAVLTSMFGLATTVYEKRTSYSRKINVKIDENFFNQTNRVVNMLGVISENFFFNLNRMIEEKNRRILICELETLFKEKAVLFGKLNLNEKHN